MLYRYPLSPNTLTTIVSNYFFFLNLVTLIWRSALQGNALNICEWWCSLEDRMLNAVIKTADGDTKPRPPLSPASSQLFGTTDDNHLLRREIRTHVRFVPLVLNEVHLSLPHCGIVLLSLRRRWIGQLFAGVRQIDNLSFLWACKGATEAFHVSTSSPRPW